RPRLLARPGRGLGMEPGYPQVVSTGMCANGGELWTDRRVAGRRPRAAADVACAGPTTSPQILSTAVWRASVCAGQAVEEPVDRGCEEARSAVSWRVPARSGMAIFAAGHGGEGHSRNLPTRVSTKVIHRSPSPLWILRSDRSSPSFDAVSGDPGPAGTCS